tara:strand:+ start:421 stop:567 length:147 start_codon:yes stop_codon:yes gene_type:complete
MHYDKDVCIDVYPSLMMTTTGALAPVLRREASKVTPNTIFTNNIYILA